METYRRLEDLVVPRWMQSYVSISLRGTGKMPVPRHLLWHKAPPDIYHLVGYQELCRLHSDDRESYGSSPCGFPES